MRGGLHPLRRAGLSPVLVTERRVWKGAAIPVFRAQWSARTDHRAGWGKWYGCDNIVDAGIAGSVRSLSDRDVAAKGPGFGAETRHAACRLRGAVHSLLPDDLTACFGGSAKDGRCTDVPIISANGAGIEELDSRHELAVSEHGLMCRGADHGRRLRPGPAGRRIRRALPARADDWHRRSVAAGFGHVLA